MNETADVAAPMMQADPSICLRPAPAMDVDVLLTLRFDDFEAAPYTPWFLGEKSRFATVTSVQFLGEDLLVCASFLGRSLSLVKLDRATATGTVIAKTATIFEAQPVETDLCAVDPSGRFIVVSNFHLGTVSLYRHDDHALVFVRDLPFKVGGFVHGLKFYDSRVLAVSACTGPVGIHFFDIESGDNLLHVPLESKAQDIAFVSPTRLIAASVLGAPRASAQPMYDSRMHLVDFDLAGGTGSVTSSKRFAQSHFDCVTVSRGLAYVTDQYNDCVRVLDAETLEDKASIGGYDFPHGLDIHSGTLAVTNYGTNSIIVTALHRS